MLASPELARHDTGKIYSRLLEQEFLVALSRDAS
jgi:hypothetical protein